MGAARGFLSARSHKWNIRICGDRNPGWFNIRSATLRVNRAVVLIVALSALLSSIYLLYAGASYTLFFVGCLIFGFYWTFYCTLHVGIIARGDDTGRAIVLCGVSPSVGAIFGSFVGGHLIHGTNYLPPACVGAALAVIGIACTLVTMAE